MSFGKTSNLTPQQMQQLQQMVSGQNTAMMPGMPTQMPPTSAYANPLAKSISIPGGNMITANTLRGNPRAAVNVPGMTGLTTKAAPINQNQPLAGFASDNVAMMSHGNLNPQPVNIAGLGMMNPGNPNMKSINTSGLGMMSHGNLNPQPVNVSGPIAPTRF